MAHRDGPLGNVSRRAVLGGFLGAGAALTLAACSPTRPGGSAGSNEHFDVIVIGAGSAGVAAARDIREAGKKVVVLEARDRTGGRMWTDRTLLSIPHERGASLCHGGPDTATWPWVEKLKLPTRKFELNSSRYGRDTPWVAWDTPAFFAFPAGTPSVSLPLPDPKNKQTAKQYLDSLGIAPENYPLALLGIQVDTEQFDSYPAARIVETLTECFEVSSSGTLPEDDYAGDFKILAPYDTVLDAVAEGLDIRLNTVVETVAYTETGVTVSAGDSSFSGTTCVIAVPLGVLQHEQITFEPALEPERIRALEAVEMTTACKTILEFDHPLDVDAFDMVNQHDTSPSQYWDESRGLPGYDGHLIVAWDTGDRARELLALPEAGRFDAALEGVRRIVGDQGIAYKAASTYDWTQDEFAFGAYATGPRDEEVLYRPIHSTVFWAGAIKSSVAAAHASGQQAAATVLAEL